MYFESLIFNFFHMVYGLRYCLFLFIPHKFLYFFFYILFIKRSHTRLKPHSTSQSFSIHLFTMATLRRPKIFTHLIFIITLRVSCCTKLIYFLMLENCCKNFFWREECINHPPSEIHSAWQLLK